METQKEKDLQRLRRFRLLDDEFMSKVFEDFNCTELLLQIVLNKADLMIRRVQTQVAFKNLQGRSIRLDVLATDSQGNPYNIEIQRNDNGAQPKRARYYSSMIDVNIINPGESFSKLPKTYVIFITEHDVLQGGQPIYHIDRTIAETGAQFGDDAHIIYVNAQIQDETALGRLMHDFSCTEADQMHYPVLAERVRYFKEDEKGVTRMSAIGDEFREEGRQIGLQQGLQQGAKKRDIELARRMLIMQKYSQEEISLLTQLPLDEVKALDERLSA